MPLAQRQVSDHVIEPDPPVQKSLSAWLAPVMQNNTEGYLVMLDIDDVQPIGKPLTSGERAEAQRTIVSRVIDCIAQPDSITQLSYTGFAMLVPTNKPPAVAQICKKIQHAIR